MTDEKQAGNSWQELVRSTWQARAAEWDQMAEAHALSEDRTADIARLAVALDLHHGSTVLDAGCGTGQLAIAFATLGCRVTAQDLAPAMIDRAQMHARDRGVDITFRIGDITDLPDERNTYDAVHARVVLQFVRNPVTALQQFRRVLKPGGRLFASVPGALSPIYNRSWRRFTDPSDTGNTFMVPWELETLLQQGGWTVLEQWGESGRTMHGEKNNIVGTEALKDIRLQQAAATTWGFVAQ